MTATHRLDLFGPTNCPDGEMHLQITGIPTTAAEMLDKLLRVTTQVGGVVAIPSKPRVVRGQLVEGLDDLRINTRHIEQWTFTKERA